MNGINQENCDKFFKIYADKLAECVRAMPEKYSWPIENVPVVVERMKAAALRGSFGWESPAFKMTCKEIGIKHGLKSIRDYVGWQS